MRHLGPILTLLSLLSVSCTPASKESESFFSFHLFNEPTHLDPARVRSSSANYLFFNTRSGLYRVDAENQLQTNGGQCQWKSPLKLHCEIKDQKWSTGEALTAGDYKRAFLHLINPETASPRAHLLSHLKNARDILQGKTKVDTLGFQIIGDKEFVLEFSSQDPEFIYKLSSTALFPIHQNSKTEKSQYKNSISNGPYEIDSWVTGKHLILKPNPHYQRGHQARPPVKIYFIEDEMTAFRLYKKGILKFLRRIPSKLYNQVSQEPHFFQVPMLRFDYIGFGKRLRDQPDLRKALALSVNYPRLKSLLNALEVPGCPSIPSSWFIEQPCYHFSIQQMPPGIKQSPRLQFKVSQMGGNDILKQAEFFQDQWKKNLGVSVEVSQVEQKVFLSELRQKAPDIFRKGVGLDRPTCLSALETFSEDSKQNFIGLFNKKYQAIVEKLGQAKDPQKYKRLCQKGLELLMDNFMIIPLGEMHFGMLASPQYKGWTINGLNQLDLSQLHPIP